MKHMICSGSAVSVIIFYKLYLVVFCFFCFFVFLFFLCLGRNMYMTVSNCPPVGSHIPFLGRLCMLALSVSFWTPRLSLSHPGSFTSMHEPKYMRSQKAPLFNVPCGRCGTTTRVLEPYPHCACPS